MRHTPCLTRWTGRSGGPSRAPSCLGAACRRSIGPRPPRPLADVGVYALCRARTILVDEFGG